MCPCGGELTAWCFDHSDWVCDDCGCAHCRDATTRGDDDKLLEYLRSVDELAARRAAR